VSALAQRLRLVVVTDPDCGDGRSVVEVVRAALRGGAPAVQLRWKDAAAREMATLGRALLRETRAAGALLLVNDRLDVALAIGAEGAHLGQDDLPAAAARALAPPGFLIGVSAETLDLARRAAGDGADYVGVGPVYATGSKADAGDAVGIERVREVAAGAGIPVVGIGGIDGARAAQVLGAGAAGVAVIGAVMRAADPRRAAAALLARAPHRAG
jgi:thiamine-phosphate pyrophosphorylase